MASVSSFAFKAPRVRPNAKHLVLSNLDKPQTLSSLTQLINYRLYGLGISFTEDAVHEILRSLDKRYLVTVKRERNDDWWYIKKQGVEYLRQVALR